MYQQIITFEIIIQKLKFWLLMKEKFEAVFHYFSAS
jgi:hypothetical protein